MLTKKAYERPHCSVSDGLTAPLTIQDRARSLVTKKVWATGSPNAVVVVVVVVVVVEVELVVEVVVEVVVVVVVVVVVAVVVVVLVVVVVVVVVVDVVVVVVEVIVVVLVLFGCAHCTLIVPAIAECREQT